MEKRQNIARAQVRDLSQSGNNVGKVICFAKGLSTSALCTKGQTEMCLHCVSIKANMSLSILLFSQLGFRSKGEVERGAGGRDWGVGSKMRSTL